MAGQQMYLVEIFIDNVAIDVDEKEKEAETDKKEKKYTINVKFGPKTEFIVKENQLVQEKSKQEFITTDDGQLRRMSTYRIGKSYLFPSFPDSMIEIINLYPLAIEVWDDDETDDYNILVGRADFAWDLEFQVYFRNTRDSCKEHPSITIKPTIDIRAECCCKVIGAIQFVTRITALGESIITDFQQLLNDPDFFVFRTNKAPSLFKVNRVEPDDPKYQMEGSLYRIALEENPAVVANYTNAIDLCTELDSCGPTGQKKIKNVCAEKPPPGEPPIIDTIRMGEIKGPCGNKNCPLVHRVKNYIRSTPCYKNATIGYERGPKLPDDPSKKICGSCYCKNDRYHSEPLVDTKDLPLCKGCGGKTQIGETCQDRLDKLHGTGVTPKHSSTKIVNYLTDIIYDEPEVVKSLYEQQFTVANVTVTYDNPPKKTSSKKQSHNYVVGNVQIPHGSKKTSRNSVTSKSNPSSKRNTISDVTPVSQSDQFGREYDAKLTKTMASGYFANVYNVTTDKDAPHNFCIDMPKDATCRCTPPKPTAPCKTIDCECLTKTAIKDSRKKHKPYCPCYQHKDTCPVTMMNDEDAPAVDEDYDDVVESLPYGLPPIKLGPCPVMGRPCSVPDGFARMYKTGALPKLPPSYSEAGKVCCSKEYERVKKALKEYMDKTKEDDFRCLNKFYVDTETRCCDKEQRLLALLGKSCCGSHKIALNEKFAEENPKK